ncbi:MAG: hypothetical protein P8J20_19125 [Novosphingobium sp.]|nr:hypothetical protein [Novosphingobium sp.]
MNRIEFNEALGAGLPGMPVPADDDIINDYEVHLVEGTAEEGDDKRSLPRSVIRIALLGNCQLRLDCSAGKRSERQETRLRPYLL